MQSSLSIQLGLFLILLSASSQALPILDRSLVAKNPEPISPPAVHNHIQERNDEDDVISLYGLYRRHLTSPKSPIIKSQHEHDARYLSHQQPEIPLLNSSPLSLQTPDSTTTFTTTATSTRTTIAAIAEATLYKQHTKLKSTTHNSHHLNPSIPLPLPIQAAHATPPQSPPKYPASLSSIHNLYAAQWNKHKSHVRPQSTQHHGSSRLAFLRPHAVLFSHDRFYGNGRKPISLVQSLFTRPGRVIGAVKDFMHAPFSKVRLGVGLGVPVVRIHHASHPHSPQPQIMRKIILKIKIPTFFSKLFRILHMPGIGPGGQLNASSALHREDNPLYSHITHHHTQPHHSTSNDKPAHIQNTEEENHLPGGTIHMSSSTLTHSLPIPLSFTLTPTTCAPLAHECNCLTRDLAARLIQAYPNGVPESTNSITETVKMLMHGEEYRATMDLQLDKAIDGKNFKDLLGLLVSVKKELAHMTQGKGFGTVNIHGRWHGVGVRAVWTYYRIEGVVPRTCA